MLDEEMPVVFSVAFRGRDHLCSHKNLGLRMETQWCSLCSWITVPCLDEFRGMGNQLQTKACGHVHPSSAVSLMFMPR